MLLRPRNWQIFGKRNFQALYVKKENLEGNLRAVESAFDFKKRLANRKELECTLQRRGIDVNITELYQQWERYKEVDKKRRSIIPRCKYWKNLMNQEITKPNVTIEMAKEKFQNANADMEIAVDELEAVESIFFPSYLSLPNVLLDTTPDEREIVSIFGNKCDEDRPHHLVYEDSIDFINGTAYYLKNAAAKFDLLFPLKCTDYFRRHNFTLFNNPDFAKTVIIEGAAIPLENVFLIPEEFDKRCTNLVHLIGNGSPLSFLGSLANIIFDFSLMPMPWVSAGKIYQPIRENSIGLYNVAQSTAVQVFLIGTKEQMIEKYKQTLHLICGLLKTLNIHFRVVNVPANELYAAECFATAIEMYSPNAKLYIEIGRISNYGEFISRRLNIHSDGDRKCGGQKPNIVAATVCNVTKLIALILETHNGRFPDEFLE